MEDIKQLVHELNYAIHGRSGLDGLKSQVEKLQAKVDQLEIRIAIIVAGTQGAAALLHYFIIA
jgi:hypothetical protein